MTDHAPVSSQPLAGVLQHTRGEATGPGSDPWQSILDALLGHVAGGTPTPKSVNAAVPNYSPTGAIVAAPFLPLVYGYNRIQGQVISSNAGAFSDHADFWIAICEGEVDAISHLYVGGRDEAAINAGYGASIVTHVFYTGTLTQTEDAGLYATLGFHPGGLPGTCYAKVTLSNSGTALTSWDVPYGTTSPVFEFDVRGRKVVDPRENMLAQSENFAIGGAPWRANTAPTTVVATGVSDPSGGTGAGRWTASATGFGCDQGYPGGGANTAQADQTDAVTASIWLRTTSGTVALTLRAGRFGRTYSSEDFTLLSVTATTTWQRFSVTQPATGTHGGVAYLQLVTAVNGAVVELFGAQVESFPTSHGYIKTTGTPILARENLFANSETYTPTQWLDLFTNPTLATGITGPFEDTSAGQWTFGTGPQYIYRIGPVVAVGEPLTFSVWLRTTSGTLATNLACGPAGAYTSAPASVTTTWQRFFVTSPPSTSAAQSYCFVGGPSQNIPTGQVLQVFGAQVEKAPTIRPYLCTDAFTGGAAAIPRPTVWTQNPALHWRDVRSITGVDAAYIDDVSFGNAAATCATIKNGSVRFVSNLVCATQTNVKSYLDQLALACNGYEVWPAGLMSLFIDVENTSAPLFTLDSTVNFQNISYSWLDQKNKPTQVRIDFRNKDASPPYSPDYVLIPAVLAVGIELVQASFSSSVITDRAHAGRAGSYLYNVANVTPFRAEGDATYVGISALVRGTKLALTTSEGVAAQEVLAEVARETPTGWHMQLRQYSAAIYADVAVPGTQPVNVATPFVNSATVDVISFPAISGAPASAYWKPPRSLGTAVDAPPIPSGGNWKNYVIADFGPTGVRCGKIESVLFSSSIGGWDPTWAIQSFVIWWSDDGSAWTQVPFLDVWGGSNEAGHSDASWFADFVTPAAPHRYWRYGPFYGSDVATLTGSVKFFPILAEIDPDVATYEIYRVTVDASVVPNVFTTSVLWKTIAASAVPVVALPLDLTTLIGTLSVSDARMYAAISVVAVRANGLRSPGFKLSISPATGNTFVPLQYDTFTLQTGSTNIDGVQRAATTQAFAAAATVPTGELSIGSTTATTANAGANGAPPAQVVGYLIVNIGGTNRKIPFYAT